jgi:hypothetical protein
MRWRLGRGRAARRGIDGGRPSPPVRAGGSHWRRVAPLKPTAAPRPPLVGGTLLELPDVTGTRPLIPLGRPVHGSGGAAGRVAGLASVRGPRAEADPGAAFPPGAGVQQTPGLPAPVRRRPMPRIEPVVIRNRALTSVDDEYLGEPQPEATPYRSSAWLRMVHAYRPQQTADIGADEALLAIAATGTEPHERTDPDAAGRAGQQVRGELPPTPTSAPLAHSTADIAQPRRATLAESRRLGIGMPLPTRRPAADAAEPEYEQGDIGQAPLREAWADHTGGDDTPAAQRPEPRVLGLGAPITPPRRQAPVAPHATPGRVTAAPRSPATATSDSARAAGRDSSATQGPDPRPESPSALRQFADSAGASAASAPAYAAPRPTAGAPVYRAALRRLPAIRAGAADTGVEPSGELIHRAAPPSGPTEPPPEPDRSESSPPVAPPPVQLPAPIQLPALPPGGLHSEVPPGFFPGPPAPQGFAPLEFAPHDLADALRRIHGVDVSDVPINRDPESTIEARGLGARAFTRDGGVFLPPDEGPLERPDTRSLLAHELAHAAQQRALGPTLPPEGSELGRRLEAQAVAAERLAFDQIPAMWTAPAATPTPPLPPPFVDGQAWSGFAPTTEAAAALSSVRVQRQPEHAAQPLPAPPPGPAASLESAAGPAIFGRASDLLGSPVAAETAAPNLAADPVGSITGPMAEAGTQVGRRERHLNLDDESAVGEFADELYRRVRTRLRRELLVDRERSGLLSDFR